MSIYSSKLTNIYALQAYDSHCNLVLGDVEETIYLVEDENDDEEDVKVRTKSSKPLYRHQLMTHCRRSGSNPRCFS